MTVRATGGKPQLFCCLEHRRQFDSALRAYASALFDAGRITRDELHSFAKTGNIAASPDPIITADAMPASMLDEAEAP